MKRHHIYAFAIAAASVSLASCNDFLDDNRYPLVQETNNPTFWSETANCDQQCDQLYSYYPGYGRSNSTGEFFFNQLTDDQAGNSFQTWHNTNVPASSTNYTQPYQVIRHCEYIIEGVNSSSLDDAVKDNYLAIARLNRAQQYFNLVKRYGDCKWVGKVVDVTDDGILYADRDSRDEVMDKVLEDLDFAAANISTQSAKLAWSKDMANAIKSYICLWEGTFCKYRTLAENGYAPDEARARRFLEKSVEAAEAVMSQGYSLNSDYKTKYQSLTDDLQSNNEIIFMRSYAEGMLYHSTQSYTCSSTVTAGITKDLFDAYLFADGLPKALTSYDTNDAATIDADGNLYFGDLDVYANRDKRLQETTDPYVFYQGFSWSRNGSSGITSSTGYGVLKFDNVSLPLSARQNSAGNYTAAPLLWLSDIYCQYAEAKAELGTLTDTDLNNTINKIFTRSGLPTRTVQELSNINDPANNMGVSSLLWEIRRCRRCELVMDKDYRYWDLIRWHQLELLDSNNHPNILLGANITNATVSYSNVNGYLDGSYGRTRTYEARQYLFPIPQNQLNLVPQMEQNPLWADSSSN